MQLASTPLEGKPCLAYDRRRDRVECKLYGVGRARLENEGKRPKLFDRDAKYTDQWFAKDVLCA